MKKLNFKPLINEVKFFFKKNGPDILVVTGVVGTVTGVVLACKATTKLEPILEEHNIAKEEIPQSIVTTEKHGLQTTKYEVANPDYNKQLTGLYFRTGWKVTKLYAPSVLLIGGSLAAIIGSHGMLTKRNAALSAAYSSAIESFRQYRENVIEKYGENADTELMYGAKIKKGKDGEVVTLKATDKTLLKDVDISRFFDLDHSQLAYDNIYDNLEQLNNIESWCNRKLMSEGVLVLNDVYKALGFEPISQGYILGWVYKANSPDTNNLVKFITYNLDRDNINNMPEDRRLEPSILINFNVMGNIYDFM